MYLEPVENVTSIYDETFFIDRKRVYYEIIDDGWKHVIIPVLLKTENFGTSNNVVVCDDVLFTPPAEFTKLVYEDCFGEEHTTTNATLIIKEKEDDESTIGGLIVIIAVVVFVLYLKSNI